MVTVLDLLGRCKALLIDLWDADQCPVEDRVGSIVNEINSLPSTIGQISDGYHTFDELYEHRFELWMAICRNLRRGIAVYKSRVQSDGTSYPGWFLLAMGTKAGSQISYHLPDRLWDACDFEEMMPPPFDGHTSADVLERLRSL